MAASQSAAPNGGSRPVPDPTVLTTEQLNRAIKAVESTIDGVVRVLEERLHGIDRATELRLSGIEAIPDQIDEKVGAAARLTDERFDSIAIQFAERDTRQERETRDNTVKVDAAFAAAKEASAKQDEANQKAIDKAEQQTTEKITKQGELLQTTTDALSDKITDLRERLGAVETARVARQEVGQEHRSSVQPFQVVIASILGSALFGGLIALLVSH